MFKVLFLNHMEQKWCWSGSRWISPGCWETRLGIWVCWYRWHCW